MSRPKWFHKLVHNGDFNEKGHETLTRAQRLDSSVLSEHKPAYLCLANVKLCLRIIVKYLETNM